MHLIVIFAVLVHSIIASTLDEPTIAPSNESGIATKNSEMLLASTISCIGEETTLLQIAQTRFEKTNASSDTRELLFKHEQKLNPTIHNPYWLFAVLAVAFIFVGSMIVLGAEVRQGNEKEEAGQLRTYKFGVPALLCAVLAYTGFYFPSKLYATQGAWVDPPPRYYSVPQLSRHAFIGIGWLALAFVEVLLGVLGSRSDSHSWRPWHRRIGYVAAAFLVITASTGSIMTFYKMKSKFSLGIEGESVALDVTIDVTLLTSACCLIGNVVAGVVTARRKEFIDHKIFMCFAVAWSCKTGLARSFTYFFKNPNTLGCPQGFANGEETVSVCIVMLLLCGFLGFGEKTRRIVLINVPAVVYLILVDIHTVVFITKCWSECTGKWLV